MHKWKFIFHTVLGLINGAIGMGAGVFNNIVLKVLALLECEVDYHLK